MKLGRCTVEHFGSYSKLEFDFSNIGLGLIYGPTGSGKSTVMDIAAWILYGVTAKGGAVDEVRSWQSPSDPTKGVISVQLSDGNEITITRIRGKASENDLYWTETDTPDESIRGKDIIDTQSRLEARLAVTSDTFLTGAYFHEFSETGTFFTAKAKDRRALFERIAPLEFPAKLAEVCSRLRKQAKADFTAAQSDFSKASGKLEQLRDTLADSVRSHAQWETSKAETVAALHARSKGFETEKTSKVEALETRSSRFEEEKGKRIDALIARIESLQEKIQPDKEFEVKISQIRNLSRCPTCSALPEKTTEELSKIREDRVKNTQQKEKLEDLTARLREEYDTENPYLSQIEATRCLENHYGDQIEAEQANKNPFTDPLDKLKLAIEEAEDKLKLTKDTCDALENRVASLSRLYDLSFNLRGELLKKAVKEIEDQTNTYLEAYFDAELRVSFSLDGDDLDVSIQKGGYECVYRQLSKGQRGLLKLCFVVSIMKAAANSSGVHFANLFFDEALDGLDADLKVKAFGMFQELESEHETVLVIEHTSEFKELFSRRYEVTLVGDESQMILEQENQ